MNSICKVMLHHLILENNSVSNYFSSVIHKGKKFNYICDINPGRINQISGKLTDLNGNGPFHGTSASSTQTYALTGIKAWTYVSSSAQRPLKRNESISTINTTAGTFSGIKILANTQINSPTIVFTCDTELDPDNFKNKLITITVDADYIFRVGNASTGASGSTVQLIKQNSRFIAEFSIIAQE